MKKLKKKTSVAPLQIISQTVIPAASTLNLSSSWTAPNSLRLQIHRQKRKRKSLNRLMMTVPVTQNKLKGSTKISLWFKVML
jgi:hypothetical protein